MSTPGTKPRPSRASCTPAPRRSACSASAIRRPTAAHRPTAGTGCIATEEIARAGSGGLMASLFSHNIGLPPVLAQGSEALKQRIVPPVLRGEKIAALAITEPSGGSDVAQLRTTARLRRWAVGDRRREGLHHLRHACRLDHAGRAHRRQGRGRHLVARRAGRRAGADANAAREDGLVVQRHGAASIRPLPRAGRSPDRRRERRLSRDHGELQRRAAADVGRCLRLRPGLLRRGAGLGAPAADLRRRRWCRTRRSATS